MKTNSQLMYFFNSNVGRRLAEVISCCTDLGMIPVQIKKQLRWTDQLKFVLLALSYKWHYSKNDFKNSIQWNKPRNWKLLREWYFEVIDEMMYVILELTNVWQINKNKARRRGRARKSSSDFIHIIHRGCSMFFTKIWSYIDF